MAPSGPWVSPFFFVSFTQLDAAWATSSTVGLILCGGDRHRRPPSQPSALPWDWHWCCGLQSLSSFPFISSPLCHINGGWSCIVRMFNLGKSKHTYSVKIYIDFLKLNMLGQYFTDVYYVLHVGVLSICYIKYWSGKSEQKTCFKGVLRDTQGWFWLDSIFTLGSKFRM